MSRFISLRLLFTVSLIAVALLPGRSTAQTPSEFKLSPAIVDDFKPLLEGVQRFTLSNGLRVVLYRRGIAPVFSGQIWVGVGGVDEVPGKTGLAHLLEHMAFKGTTTIGTKDFGKEEALLKKQDAIMAQMREQPSEQLQSELAEVEKALDALWVDNEFSRLYSLRGATGLNAGTSKDFTFYMVALPSVAFEFWCWVESERLLHPVFRQFYKEREVVHEERRMSFDDSPSGLLYEALLALAYWNHPYRLPVIGWSADIDHLQRPDIIKLHDQFYRPDNMVVSLVGDLDAQTVRPLLEKYFGRIPAAKGPVPRVHVAEPVQRGERSAVVYFDAKPEIMLGYHKPVHPDPDDAYFAVLHAVLSDGRTSLLYRELVEQRKLASDVQTDEAPGELFPSMFIVAATPRDGVSSGQLRDAIQGIFDRLKKQPLEKKVLDAAKRRVRMSLLEGMDSSYGLAKIFGHAELLWGDWREHLTIYDRVFATTPKDLQRLAQKYLNVTNRSYVELKQK